MLSLIQKYLEIAFRKLMCCGTEQITEKFWKHSWNYLGTCKGGRIHFV